MTKEVPRLFIGEIGLAIVLNEIASRGKLNGLIRLVGVVLAALSVFSCTPQLHCNEQLRIGTNIWPGYEPLYLARELDYFSDQEVRLVEFSSASQVMRAYRNGVIDAAALSLDETILLLSQGYNPRIILVMDISTGADAIIGRPEINEMADLVGKKVGVENSALGIFMLSRALELNNMTIDQVEIIPLTIDKHHHAFEQGWVDAVVTFEPIKTALKKRLGNVLFDSTEIPAEIVDVLVIREQFLKDHPESASNIQKGWYKALNYFGNHANEAAAMMSSRLGLKPTEVLASFEELILPAKQQNDQLLGYQQKAEPELLNTATKLYGSMIKQGIKPEAIELRSLFLQEQYQ